MYRVYSVSIDNYKCLENRIHGEHLDLRRTKFSENIIKEFRILFMSLVRFLTLRFGDWILPPSSDKMPTQLGSIDRASPYLRISEIEIGSGLRTEAEPNI
jgi:hypothetical protein